MSALGRGFGRFGRYAGARDIWTDALPASHVRDRLRAVLPDLPANGIAT
jgi:hypothetical protein